MIGCLFDDMLVYQGMKGCSRKEQGCKSCHASASRIYSGEVSGKNEFAPSVEKDLIKGKRRRKRDTQ